MEKGTHWRVVAVIWIAVAVAVIGAASSWGPEHTTPAVLIAICGMFMATVCTILIAYGASVEVTREPTGKVDVHDCNTHE